MLLNRTDQQWISSGSVPRCRCWRFHSTVDSRSTKCQIGRLGVACALAGAVQAGPDNLHNEASDLQSGSANGSHLVLPVACWPYGDPCFSHV